MSDVTYFCKTSVITEILLLASVKRNGLLIIVSCLGELRYNRRSNQHILWISHRCAKFFTYFCKALLICRTSSGYLAFDKQNNKQAFEHRNGDLPWNFQQDNRNSLSRTFWKAFVLLRKGKFRNFFGKHSLCSTMVSMIVAFSRNYQSFSQNIFLYTFQDGLLHDNTT